MVGHWKLDVVNLDRSKNEEHSQIALTVWNILDLLLKFPVNCTLILFSEGDFLGFFQYFIQHCFTCAPAIAIAIQLGRGLCDRTQGSCDFGIGCQTL